MVKFKTVKLTDVVTRIIGINGEQMYLVEGREKAALIDTGSGAGDLKACVEALTSLPILVLITHGHVDHAMGAPQFEKVYMSMLDLSLIHILVLLLLVFALIGCKEQKNVSGEPALDSYDRSWKNVNMNGAYIIGSDVVYTNSLTDHRIYYLEKDMNQWRPLLSLIHILQHFCDLGCTIVLMRSIIDLFDSILDMITML